MTTKLTIPTLKKFPALYQSREGTIALAKSPVAGIVIHSEHKEHPVGLEFPEQALNTWEASGWTRVTHPITVEFSP